MTVSSCILLSGDLSSGEKHSGAFYLFSVTISSFSGKEEKQ